MIIYIHAEHMEVFGNYSFIMLHFNLEILWILNLQSIKRKSFYEVIPPLGGGCTELKVGGEFCLSLYALPYLYGLTFLVTMCIYFYYLKREVIKVSEKSFHSFFLFWNLNKKANGTEISHRVKNESLGKY